jgi:serine/threonine protein kinase/Flp pilus assembly protein TadD
VKTEGKRVCEVCGTLLPETSDACPVCVLRGALTPQDDSRPSSVDPNLSELCFEHYQVLKDEDGTPMELGHGAMGITYKAFDIDLRFPVTLKVISEKYIGDESARLRFLREARAAAKVRHPNVASVFHLGRSSGEYFYSMEFVEGETLESLIKRSGRLEVKLALEIAAQVAAGLTAVHKQNLVHRDIKPSNIMVSLEEGGGVTAKIIDLGLAKGAGELGSESAISTPGAFAGTPEFASPEQFAGIGVDIRSDLYSLGVTLWEMLTGRPPFRGTPAELIYQHQHEVLPLEQLKGVPHQVRALLEVLLEKAPKRRFQTPAELLKTLSTVASELERPANEKQEVRTPLVRKVRSQRTRSPRAKSQERSVAVLPFESLSASKRDTYFADGVQDEILSNLAKISQLKVISRTSVMTYRPAANRDLRTIASVLGVGKVIEGTVRRSGNRVRIATRLVDAQTGETLWSESYDRNLSDIFAIQSEIAQIVASRLSAQLSPEERKDILERPTNNLEAYDLYLEAKQLLQANYWVLQKDESEIYQRIISLLENATAKDSKFALAYCLLAKAHDMLYVDEIDHTPERLALGDAAVNEALRLRPDLPEAHLALAAHLYYCYRDFEKARFQISIAARSLSNNADLLELTALIDQKQGRWEQAVSGLERATRLDPRNPELLGGLAETYRALRRYRDAERTRDRAIEVEPHQPAFLIGKAIALFGEKADVKGARAAFEAFPPSAKDDPWIAFFRVYLAACARDFAAAEEILSESPNKEISYAGALVPRRIVMLFVEFLRGNHPTMEEFGAAREELYRRVQADPSNPFLMAGLALADLALGRKQESIREGQRAMEMRPMSKDAVDGRSIATMVAIVYAWTSQPDTAFEQLNIVAKMPGWYLSYGNLKTDPAWDPLRKDPRFDKLLAQLAPKD